MTPRQRVIRAGLLALLANLDGVILPSTVRAEVEALLRPLAGQGSLAEGARPIIKMLLEEYDGK